MKIVIVRIDLDKCTKRSIERLVQDGVITLGEGTDAKVIRVMNDLEKLMWIRSMKDGMRKAG